MAGRYRIGSGRGVSSRVRAGRDCGEVFSFFFFFFGKSIVVNFSIFENMTVVNSDRRTLEWALEDM